MQMRGRQLLRIKNRTSKARVMTDALSGFFENDLTTSAAAISYYTMLMLFPLLVVLLSVGQAVPGGAELRTLFVSRVLAYLPGTQQFVRENVETLENISASAVISCVLLVVWALTWTFTVIEKAINRIWVTRPRAFLHGRLVAVAMIGLLALILVASAVLTASVSMIGAAAEHLPRLIPAGAASFASAASQVALAVVSFFVTTVLFSAIFKLMPNAQVAWMEVLPGAVITALAWEGLKQGFAFLLPRFLEEYKLLYGGAWLALVILTWVYMSSIVMLFGAQLTAVLHCRHETTYDGEHSASTPGMPERIEAK